jgi:hypothetical protein
MVLKCAHGVVLSLMNRKKDVAILVRLICSSISSLLSALLRCFCFGVFALFCSFAFALRFCFSEFCRLVSFVGTADERPSKKGRIDDTLTGSFFIFSCCHLRCCFVEGEKLILSLLQPPMTMSEAGSVGETLIRSHISLLINRDHSAPSAEAAEGLPAKFDWTNSKSTSILFVSSRNLELL